ncbi:g9122 [Coccomyxa elongata]
MGSVLWTIDEPAPWLDHLDAAKDRLQALQDDRLTELERWFWEQLPEVLRERSPPQLHGEEIVTIVEWKLKREKWRPKLLDYAKSLKEDDVQQISEEAFNKASKISEKANASADLDGEPLRDALQSLTQLKGVGPATASAILTACCRDVPFMSDEAMAAALTGPKVYTAARYLEFARALRLKADRLTDKLGRRFSAQDVERALWSEALAQKPPKKATGKRKR